MTGRRARRLPHRDARRPWPAVLLALLALAPALATLALLPVSPSSAGQPAGGGGADPSFDGAGLLTTPWAGPTDATGWHFRVPVVIEPRLNGTTEGFGLVDLDASTTPGPTWPAMVTLDLERLLPPAGWLADPDTGNLVSFTLDTNSLRVVEVTGFSRADQAVVQRPSATGMDRYAVPHLLFEGSLTSTDPAPFHPSTNPVVSLVFLVDEPHERHTFHVYFDIRQNGEKPAATFSAAEQGRLDEIWYARQANVFTAPSVGADKPVNKRCVVVTAQHDRTLVRATIGERIVVAGSQPEFEGRLDAGERAIVRLGSEEPTQGLVKVAASRPVEAALVVDNDNPTGSTETCRGGRFAGLASVHHHDGSTGPTGPYHVTPLADKLAIARLAGSRVIVRLADLEGNELGRYTFDPAANHNQPGRVFGVTPLAPITVEVQGAADARVAVVSLGQGLVHGATPTGRPWDALAAAPAGHEGQYRLVAPSTGRAFVGLTDDASVLYQGNVSVPAGVDPIDGAPVRGFWSLIDGGKPVANRAAVVFASALNDARPAALYSSTNNIGDLTVSLYTPVAGQGGTLFEAFTRDTSAIVVPLFPSTRVSVQSLTQAGISWTNRTLTPPGSLTLSNDGGHVVDTSKPAGVFLHRSSTTSLGGVLPGRPLFLDAQPLPPEWGGFLVGLTTDETSVLVAPGRSVTVELEASNLGRRNSGQYLADRAELEVACTTANCTWGVGIQPSNLGFPAARDSPQTVRLTLTPPEGASPEDPSVRIVVTARSLGNPNMAHELTLGAGVRVRFGVLATFDVDGLEPEPRASRVVEKGERASYDVAIVNTGDVTDTVELDVQEVGGFATRILDGEGEPISSVTLEAGQHRIIRLEVAAPAAESAFLSSFATLVATSAGDNFQLSTVTATTSINPNVKVLLTADERTKRVLPGERVAFNVTIVNLGDVSDVMRVAVAGSPPPGWDEAVVEGLATEDRVSVAPTRPVVIQVVTRAPADASPLSQYTLRLAVSPESDVAGEGGGRVELNAVVGRRFALELEGTELVLGEPTDTLPVQLTLRNRGNADETYTPVVLGAPAGWSLDTGGPITLTLDGSAQRNMTLRFHDRAPQPGTYTVGLGLVPRSQPDAVLERSIDVEVFPFSGLAVGLDPTPREPLPPGRTLTTELVIENTGNQEALVTTTGTWPDALRFTGPPDGEQLLDAGEALRLPARLTVRPGTAPGTLTLELTASSVGAEASAAIPIDTEPLDLALVGPRLVETRSGAVVQATVVNRGNATASNVTVTLEEDGLPLRNVTITTVPPGSENPVSLIVREGADPSRLALRLIGGDGEEATPEDNVVRVEAESAGLPVPWGLVPAALAAAALGARTTHRTRRGAGPGGDRS